MTPERLAEIKARHPRVGNQIDPWGCGACDSYEWYCDAIELIHELEKQYKIVARLRLSVDRLHELASKMVLDCP